ncbi:TPA: hypothetical protein ACSJUE_002288 [Listeria monocytogenes]|nr:hypothetical protein [Listeria monocytogenes]
MGTTYYVKRKHIKDLDGAIFDKLRGKLKEMTEDGRAVLVKLNMPTSDYAVYEKNRDYVKYFC